MAMQRVTIFTDGACRKNPGLGGWAAILMYQGRQGVLSGSAPNTTNNRMELIAAIEGLNALKRPGAVELFTDSQYLRKVSGTGCHGRRLVDF
jgi:ribonuclease HI